MAFLDYRLIRAIGQVMALIPFLQACSPSAPDKASNALASATACLDRYHEAAAKAQFQEYFQCMDDSSVFVGTDAGEHWTKAEFMAYAQPHFERGKAWNMQAVTRLFHFTADSSVAWFEELLDTRMKLCRGSGVMTFANGSWKIQQYVLSATVPNEIMGDLIRLKSAKDDSLLQSLTP
ncbi:MAG: nuclear transport factor 2 family protein [Sphingomonadales bacterium]|nr:nuclear transport factor 2 family protein [Sphingomonadales bacterium]